MASWQRSFSSFKSLDGDSAVLLGQDTLNAINNTAEGNFLDFIKQTNEEVTGFINWRKVIAADRKLRNARSSTSIVELYDIGEFQQASDLMQPYLVANPLYRKEYNAGMAAGFEDGFSLVDRFKSRAIGVSDRNFQCVVNGLVTSFTKGCYTFVGANSLKTTEQIDMLANWHRMNLMDWEDEDPLSQYNASVG